MRISLSRVSYCSMPHSSSSCPSLSTLTSVSASFDTCECMSITIFHCINMPQRILSRLVGLASCYGYIYGLHVVFQGQRYPHRRDNRCGSAHRPLGHPRLQEGTQHGASITSLFLAHYSRPRRITFGSILWRGLLVSSPFQSRSICSSSTFTFPSSRIRVLVTRS